MTRDNDKKFRPVKNSTSGDVSVETIFHYHQMRNIVWAEYSGGDIVRGYLIAICDDSDALNMRYQHVNSAGKLMTGICNATPENLPDGRIRLHEKWQWTCGDHSKGESVTEELRP